jgi:hypothetical protein
MGLVAAALAILGLAIGIAFRLRVLLPILGLLLVISSVFAVAGGLDFVNTALVVITAQAIVQTSYFLGILARALLVGIQRMRTSL